MAKFIHTRQKAKGTAPGSLIFLGKQKMDTPDIGVINYNSENITEKKVKNLKEATAFINDNSITWINIYGMHNTELIEKLGKFFNISSLVLESLLNMDQRPRLWEDTDYIATVLKASYYNKEHHTIDLEQISFILGKNYLITLQEQPGDHFEMVRKRMRSSVGRIRTNGPDYLMFALKDSLIDNYIINIELVGDAIENTESELSSDDPEIANKIYHYKTNISFLRKNLRPLKELTSRLVNSEIHLINVKSLIYYKELEELITQALEAIDFYFGMISDQLNIYNTHASNRANDVMKVLTIFAAIFIPLTFIAGIYGTNFDFVPELHYKYSYFIMWGVMVIVAIIMLIYFKRKKWL